MNAPAFRLQSILFIAFCLTLPAWAVAQDGVAVDIELTSSESVDPVIAGSGFGNLSYVVTATNLAAFDATGVAVSATIMFPAGVTLDTVTPSGAGTWSDTNPGTWTIGNLAASASETLTIVMTVGPSTAEGIDTISLDANVSAVVEPDGDPANDTTSQTTSVGATTATWRVNKDFVDDNPSSVTMSLSCTSGTVSSPVQVSEGNPQSLTVEGFLVPPFDSTTCTVTESNLPADYFQLSSTADCQIVGVEHQGTYTGCVFVNAPNRATFEVTKEFDDGNPDEVEVTISCNTGLPLEQTTSISEGDGVTFVVTDFTSGDMDCDVSEEVPVGYSQSYAAGGPSNPTSDDTGCHFTAIEGGAQNSCAITNNLDEVEVEVTKIWLDANPQFNPVNIAEANWFCSNVADGPNSGFLQFFGNPDTESFFVFPSWDGGTDCEITEVNIPDGGVEVDDSDCQSILVFPGTGDSCEIINTRLFEGIPTLSRNGLALLALLMLGVGWIGFRRFA